MPPAKSTQKYVRNLRNAQVSFRIGGREGKRLELKPRGMRGDMLPVTKGEIEQLDDLGLLYEVITATEANAILEKQTTNQQAYHPALAYIRNEKGEEYTQGVVLAEEAGEQGVVVAHLDPNQSKRTIGIERVGVPGSVGYQDSVSAAVAHQQGLEGPEAGGVTKVTLEPPQKSA